MYENNTGINMTTEEYKKQAELDEKPFNEVSQEEQIKRLVKTIINLEQGNTYYYNRINSMEQEIRSLKQHEHGVNGDVMVKAIQQNIGLGAVSGNSLKKRSLLD